MITALLAYRNKQERRARNCALFMLGLLALAYAVSY